MIKLKSTDQQPPGTRLAVIKGDDMFCYFDDDPEVIDAVAQRVREQEQQARAQRKHERAQDIKRITVTTASGHIFNGDESSQQRMARAIMVLADTDTLDWTLADNTVAAIRKAELIEVLKLSVMQQAALWRITP